MSGFRNNFVRVYAMKLKIGILDHTDNTFRNTVFQISVDVPLILWKNQQFLLKTHAQSEFEVNLHGKFFSIENLRRRELRLVVYVVYYENYCNVYYWIKYSTYFNEFRF